MLNVDILDQVIKVSDEQAFETTRLLARTEGVFAGMSSGANLYAATELALKEENRQDDCLYCL